MKHPQQLLRDHSEPRLTTLVSKNSLVFSKLYEYNIIIFIHTDDSCQYWLNLKDKKLTSPYYPKWFFADGRGCEWLISGPEGHTIALEFEEFKVRY